MALNNNECVGKALELLRDGVRPFVERELKASYGDNAMAEAQKILSQTHVGIDKWEAMRDVAIQLRIIDRLWADVFRKRLDKVVRSLVNELLDTRNRWAHQHSFSDDDTDRALDSVARLLTAISSPQAAIVADMRMQQRDLISNRGRISATTVAKAPQGVESVSGNRHRVLDFITRFPGRDDDEIPSALKISPRQTVNQICRKLCQERLVHRTPGGRGKLVNFPVSGASVDLTAAVPSAQPLVQKADSQAMSEDDVKAALCAKLEAEGWSVDVAWGRARGIDIVAQRGAERWIIECKGTGSLPPMQNNYLWG
jgi:hypothetical protein